MNQGQGLLIRGGRIVDPSQGIDGIGDMLLENGVVGRVALGRLETVPPSCQVIEAQGLVVCPGLIDLHCHLREPGYEHQETIASGSQAAVHGGFTTICAMPNTNPPIDSKAGVDFILEKAVEAACRVLPIGCTTRGQQGKQLTDMAELAEAGVVGFSDDGHPVSDALMMRYALEYSRGLGLPIMEHCEDLALSAGGLMHEGWVATRLGLRGIPAAAEEVAVARNIALAEHTGGWLHVCHVSTAGSVDLILRAKERGLRVTAEVTPHHLTLTDERALGQEYGIGAAPASPTAFISLTAYNTNTKVSPPLRSRQDVAALVAALKDGTIDVIATDHAPHADVDKACEYGYAANGISGLETALGNLLYLVHSGQLELSQLIAKLTTAPAQFLRQALAKAKGVDALLGLGTLQEGAPADVVVFDPNREWVVEQRSLASKGKNTPLLGSTLKGKVVLTLVGGEVAYADEAIAFKG